MKWVQNLKSRTKLYFIGESASSGAVVVNGAIIGIGEITERVKQTATIGELTIFMM